MATRKKPSFIIFQLLVKEALVNRLFYLCQNIIYQVFQNWNEIKGGENCMYIRRNVYILVTSPDLEKLDRKHVFYVYLVGFSIHCIKYETTDTIVRE